MTIKRKGAQSLIPLWLKLGYLAFIAVLVPAYALEYSPLNFLWFSNLALMTGLAAVWLESRWLASMALIAVALPDMAWSVDFLGSLILGGTMPLGFVGYMYDESIPPWIRALSLYHLPLPFLLFWTVWRIGYEPRAWRAMLIAGYAVLILSWFLSTPEENVNWVLGPYREPQSWMPPLAWLALVMAACAVLWWLTHRLVIILLTGLRKKTRTD